MKKDSEKQAGQRVGLPLFFLLELEDVYRHREGAHRALAFPDFVGMLVGMGYEQYRKQIAPPVPAADTEPDGEHIPARLDAWDDFPETDTLRIPRRKRSA